MSITHVVFKAEDEIDGASVGPVVVYETTPEEDADQSLGRPYKRKCVCQQPPPEATCSSCGGEVVRWVTHAEASAIAQEHGVSLEVG